MPTEDIEAAQDMFLSQGGLLVHALRDKRKQTNFGDKSYLVPPGKYEHQEYPKIILASKGVRKIDRFTEDINKKRIEWVEEKEAFDEILVFSEEDEERVLAGGKTSAAMEDERQTLIRRCRAQGIKTDPNWSALRLKRELGEKMDAPEPVDDMAALKDKLARLEEMQAMKARIAALEAELSGRPPEDPDTLRQQLADLGVTPDKRWGAVRLREELERATEPVAA